MVQAGGGLGSAVAEERAHRERRHDAWHRHPGTLLAGSVLPHAPSKGAFTSVGELLQVYATTLSQASERMFRVFAKSTTCFVSCNSLPFAQKLTAHSYLVC